MTTPRSSVGQSLGFDARSACQLFRRRCFLLRAPGSVAMLSLALGCMSTFAQQTTNQPLGPAATPSPSSAANMHPEQQDPMGVHMAHQMAERRNEERQKQLVADTDKLLSLAQSLKDDVDKSSKDQLSLDVVKRAEQIEKLAKSVKEKMKGY